MERSCFRDIPFMGVIHVNVEAMKVGFRMGDPSWSNLGQGQPEVGEIPGGPPRINSIEFGPDDHAYGHVEGLPELREAIAAHYNRLYRRGKASQYTPENVCVCPGGRAGLTRTAATFDKARLGYFTPDYTAYEDMLTTFSRVEPVHIELTADTAFRIAPDELTSRIGHEKLDAVLISNPCNPTGAVIQGDELAAWAEIARTRDTTLLMDEFYSHYVFRGGVVGEPASIARYVGDVDEDGIVIFDGLTKCFRYPGWRIGWALGPKDVIRNITAAGSFIDGGPSRPIQRGAIVALEPGRADQETQAMAAHFAMKQQITVEKLTAMGVEFPAPPEGTFYAWGSVANLPAPLNTGEGFMRAGFGHRVLTVPGEFFDVNPHKRRTGESPLVSMVRFSFGPPVENLVAGLDRLGEMVGEASAKTGQVL